MCDVLGRSGAWSTHLHPVWIESEAKYQGRHVWVGLVGAVVETPWCDNVVCVRLRERRRAPGAHAWGMAGGEMQMGLLWRKAYGAAWLRVALCCSCCESGQKSGIILKQKLAERTCHDGLTS